MYLADRAWIAQTQPYSTGPMEPLANGIRPIVPNLGTSILTQSDPTDHALAAIASIYDPPESHGENEKPAEKAPSIAPTQADGYSRLGPGPIAALRIKWTVRHAEHDEYYVDETIGEHSTPAASGALSREDAV